MTGDMMVSFPAGIIQVFAHNPSPAQLSFHVRSLQQLDNLVSNKELVNVYVCRLDEIIPATVDYTHTDSYAITEACLS